MYYSGLRIMSPQFMMSQIEQLQAIARFRRDVATFQYKTTELCLRTRLTFVIAWFRIYYKMWCQSCSLARLNVLSISSTGTKLAFIIILWLRSGLLCSVSELTFNTSSWLSLYTNHLRRLILFFCPQMSSSLSLKCSWAPTVNSIVLYQLSGVTWLD